MIFYNGSTGSLGTYFAPALGERHAIGASVRSRLDDRSGLRAELDSLGASIARGTPVTWVHMAAMVSVPGCEKEPERAHKDNVTDALATVRDFVAWAEARAAMPRIVYVSSGHVYAARADGTRASETYPVAPRSVYARTKLLAEQALIEYAQAAGVPLRIARVFGLIAPRQPDHYMLPGLIRRVRERKLDGVPGLSYHRDFLDSRDVCDRLIALCQHDMAALGVPGEIILNVCSGRATRLREVVECIVNAIAPDQATELLAALREAPGRPDDIPWIVGDPTKITELLQAEPQRVPLIQTVRDAV